VAGVTGPSGPSELSVIGLLRERSVQLFVAVWVVGSGAVSLLCMGGAFPLNRPVLAGMSVTTQVLLPAAFLAFVLFQMGVVHFLTRRRTVPDLAARAPAPALARREAIFLWLYGGVVLVAGRVLGLHFFGEGIGLHMNGAIFGCTRMVSQTELWAWAGYNFVFYALIPYGVFRARGYSHEALGLKSNNLKNDVLVTFVIMAIGSAVDLLGGGFLKLTPHQMLLGAPLTFFTHVLGTGIPIMVFIYAILFPRYLRLTNSRVTAVFLGGLSYAALHIFEYWTLYDSLPHAAVSLIVVLLQFGPPGMMKAYLTLRTGNAWVHLWAYHAVTPHVTNDTPMVVDVFRIR
jgi:hypothetical protein